MTRCCDCHLARCSVCAYSAITEHSMCQPGLPLPQGLSQAGSPGLEAFHRTKSLRDRFSCMCLSTAVRTPGAGGAGHIILCFLHNATSLHTFSHYDTNSLTLLGPLPPFPPLPSPPHLLLPARRSCHPRPQEPAWRSHGRQKRPWCQSTPSQQIHT